MKKIIAGLALLFSMGAVGCAGYLDMVPEKDIETIESIFEIRNSASNFYNSCFGALNIEMTPGSIYRDPSMVGGGEFTAADILRNTAVRTNTPTYYMGEVLGIMDGFQNANSPYCNLWQMANAENGTGSVYACIRYCNIFIENIEKVNNMEMQEKLLWKAEIMCLKALYYFELMKRYGPIVLVPENLPTNVDIVEMQSPRSPVDECFEEIVRLFDEAMPHLINRDERGDKGTFNRQSASALKARVLLFAASPLFNGNEWYANFRNRDDEQLFSQTYDHEKWKRAAEAADEAVAIAEEHGLKLAKGDADKSLQKQNHIVDIQLATYISQQAEESEWLFAVNGNANVSSYSTVAPRFRTGLTSSTGQQLHNTNNWQSLTPHIDIVEMFYSENGVPISKDRTWPYEQRYRMGIESNTEYTDIVELEKNVLNLHLRREPRFYAKIGAGGNYIMIRNTPQLIEPYRNGTMGTELPNFNDGTNPQNITGYWSKGYRRNGDDVLATSVAAYSIYPMMRLADLYLMQAEAWNEYEGPTERIYAAIDKVRERAGIPPIRQAWNQFSTAPSEITNQNGLREAIRQERMIEFAFEGIRCWDLRRWKVAHEYLNEPHRGWDVMGETAEVFYNHYEGPIIVSMKPNFVSPRDYFWPIKSEEIMICNIVQNPGWGANN